MMPHVLDNLIASAILMAVVMIIRRSVALHLGARAAFALWLAPLARLLMPTLPAPAATPDILIQTQAVANGAIEPVRAVRPLDAILFWIWAGGAMLFLSLHLARYVRFVRRATATGRPLREAGDERVVVLETPVVTGPAAAGLLRPRIFVPENFAELFAADEQTLAIKHELMHHRRGDLWASAAALAVLAVHWFNPLAYAAHRAFRRDLEGACDADLLAGAEQSERQAYARTILRCAVQPIPKPICALTDCKELKGRLMMMKNDTSLPRRLGGAATALGLTAAGLLLAAPAAAQQDKSEVHTEVRKVIMHGPNGDRELSPEASAEMAKCSGEKFEATSGQKTKEWKLQKTRIVICPKPGESKEEMAASLEKAVARVQGQSDLPQSTRAKLVAEMKARIAELRAGH